MNTINLSAEERKVFGKRLKALRREGKLPGNVFGKNIKSQAVSINTDEFKKAYSEAGETSLINLKLGKENLPVLVSDMHKDPVSGNILHVDLKQVDLKEKVKAQVPVDMVGESPAEKQGLGTVVLQLDEVEVEALPTDLPEKFEVDISKLTEANQSVLVKDLPYDKSKVEMLENEDSIVVKVEEVKEEVVEEVPQEEVPEAGTEGETKEEGKEETQETPQEESNEE